MDWQALRETLPRDRDLTPRAFRLSALRAVLNGSHYDHIKTAFDEETNGAGEYVALRQRRPSVRSGLCRVVVDDSVALLASEGHFPSVHGADPETLSALSALVKERCLNELMSDAATIGSVGSVAILFRVLSGKPFFSALTTENLTPLWNPQDPDSLESVTERYKVRGRDLAPLGYSVDPTRYGEAFWFQRQWTANEETWFMPWAVSSVTTADPQRDTARTVEHGLGFVPVVWIRNLPGGEAPDGACTFEAAVDTVIEIDYQLSQAGRALKYAGDPRLVIRDPSGSDRPIVGGAANAITISDPAGDVKLLEINGSAASATLDYVRYLRSLALESAHGNRADADKLSSAQSGRAMELMNQPLVWLADRLRTSYGEGGLLQLFRMVCAASEKVQRGEGGLLIAGKRYLDLNPDGLILQWPRWYSQTADERSAEASTLTKLTAAGLLSRTTARRILSDTYDVENLEAEQLLIDADQAQDALRAATAATSDADAA